MRNPSGDKHLSHLANIRTHQQSWGRRALGLFVAVWLNLAMQPCAMAYEADDHDCPHCPPAETHEHGDMHGSMDQKMPCADGASDCSIDEDWNHDSRGGKSKLNDAPTDSLVAIAPHEFAALHRHAGDAPLRPRHTLLQAGAPPPLYVLNCAYLK